MESREGWNQCECCQHYDSHLLPLEHLSKHDVLAVEVRGDGRRNEELLDSCDGERQGQRRRMDGGTPEEMIEAAIFLVVGLRFWQSSQCAARVSAGSKECVLRTTLYVLCHTTHCTPIPRCQWSQQIYIHIQHEFSETMYTYAESSRPGSRLCPFRRSPWRGAFLGHALPGGGAGAGAGGAGHR